MELIALFAVTALFLAVLGIYGVISYAVSERTHEISVRLALGADSQGVMGMVIREGARLAIIGACVGLVGALVVSRAIAGLLVGVSPSDPLTFGLATLVLSAAALAGCYFPARHAIRIDPILALR
jgi:putative ABC transport system permease protein